MKYGVSRKTFAILCQTMITKSCRIHYKFSNSLAWTASQSVIELWHRQACCPLRERSQSVACSTWSRPNRAPTLAGPCHSSRNHNRCSPWSLRWGTKFTMAILMYNRHLWGQPSCLPLRMKFPSSPLSCSNHHSCRWRFWTGLDQWHKRAEMRTTLAYQTRRTSTKYQTPQLRSCSYRLSTRADKAIHLNQASRSMWVLTTIN